MNILYNVDISFKGFTEKNTKNNLIANYENVVPILCVNIRGSGQGSWLRDGFS